MLKKFFVALAIALAAILVLCWVYLPSITRYRELKSEEEHLNQKIQEIDASKRRVIVKSAKWPSRMAKDKPMNA